MQFSFYTHLIVTCLTSQLVLHMFKRAVSTGPQLVCSQLGKAYTTNHLQLLLSTILFFFFAGKERTTEYSENNSTY